ncbi:transporter substrate-binding domain-containing protein [Desulfobotulus sp. H1]|uniref:Transporter substrate-binding domain-containing protein n=1 Tax=Desulfobotulus pelophilus TaxID=2823377 RepID=A0ABT3N9B9_9BACT|nr:transporter substrate-binding domain-containing protein [Desulfobotulus pelophilus]MCW7753602.1 transporter substrate-binding domain-containing protein [Desulfobotulus pelophilus]
MPPWVEGGYGPTSKGPGIDLVATIFSHTGRHIQVVIHPWLRVVRMLEFGRLDGVLLVQKQESLNSLLLYSDPLFTSRTLICYDTRKYAHIPFNDIYDLREYTIGLVPGHSPHIEDAARKHGFRTELLPGVEAGLRILAAGRIDLLIAKESSLQAHLAASPDAIFLDIHSQPLDSWDLHIGIARTSPAAMLLPAINEAIAEMKKDGTLIDYLNAIIEPSHGGPQ